MNIKSFSFILLRILAAYLFLNSFIPNIISMSLLLFRTQRDYGGYDSSDYTAWILMAVIYLAVSLILWFGAGRISSFIQNGNKDDDITKSGFVVDDNSGLNKKLDKNGIIEAGLVLIGVYFLVQRIPLFISELIVYNQFPKENTQALFRIIASLAQSFVTITLAFCFILGKEKILFTINKFRNIGMEKVK